MEKIKILIRFPNKVMTAEEYLGYCKNFLLQLRKIEPRFNSVYAWGRTAKSGRYLAEDLSDFNDVVLKQLSRGLAFINTEQDDIKLHLHSKSYIDFHNSYSNTNSGQDEISIGISCGSIDTAPLYSFGVITIYFSDDLQNKLDFNYLSSLFKLVINEANPLYASVGTFELNKLIQSRNRIDEEKYKENIELGWLTYLKKPELVQWLPEDVEYELIANGIFFWLSKDRVLSNNTEAIKKGIIIRNILEEHNLLSQNNYINK